MARQPLDSRKTGMAVLFLLLIVAFKEAEGGPALGALCSAGCASLVVACYAGAGAVFGTITAGAGTPPAILACNAAFGTCMGNCAVVTAAPTPNKLKTFLAFFNFVVLLLSFVK